MTATEGYGQLRSMDADLERNFALMMQFTSGIDSASSSGMDDASFNRLQVIRLSGAPEDAVRFWIREGLLRGPDLGPRKRLRFDRDEVKIACFLREVRAIGLNVAAMRALVAKLREGVALYKRFGTNLDFEALEYARQIAKGENAADVLAKYSGEPPAFSKKYLATLSVDEREAQLALRAQRALEYLSKEDMTELAMSLVRDFPFDDIDLHGLGEGFSEACDVMTAWLDEAGEWQFKNGHPQDGHLPASSVIAFDWSRICAIDWSLAGVP